ncbi:hypothetical protein O7635_13800 [Asanoa sp. WMMD1127]|uniref:hypothetical protein n=1 Tax=Asanoa sp. WMMD1127 TaxID=3016107 RepID=UPI0024170A96|nr:hypothetical protein [Asanoa sp. WMMD1127]MDG4822924.1 hypothetical protein [Asanoa sp. WMMD1127]
MPNAERFPSGAVTRLGPPPPDLPPPPEAPSDGTPRRRLWWFAGVAALILVTGLVAVLVARPGSGDGLLADKPEAPVDARPPLARACPPPPDAPSGAASAPPAPSPAPTGARTVDETTGISYPAYGPPWEAWTTVWNAGELEVPYKVGQHFVTEQDYDGASDYHASVLSGAVPAATNDAFTFDLECVGRQVAADARAHYYPQPNEQELIRDERTVLGGRPAWVTVFRLHFSSPGLRARSELVALACIDVGKPTAAVLYVSVPETHRQWDWVADDALAGMRPV